VIVAAALCPAAPLLARELTGVETVLPELRAACADAAGRLVRAAPDLIAVVGAGPETREFDGAATLDLAAFGGGFPPGPPGTPGLPAPLGLGARLLDEARYAGPRVLQAIGAAESPDACAGVGRQLAAAAGRVGLLVMADGSARRGPRAPGHLDERAAAFDAAVERAIRDGDLAALAAVDPALAADVMATGRPAWQVLAGAADPRLADPGTAGPGAADPRLADPGTAGPSAAGPGAADPRLADPGTAGPSAAGPGTADPGTAGPGADGAGAGGGGGGGALGVEVLYSGDPFGVAYLVAVFGAGAARAGVRAS
jgi:hypothetical protein